MFQSVVILIAGTTPTAPAGEFDRYLPHLSVVLLFQVQAFFALRFEDAIWLPPVSSFSYWEVCRPSIVTTNGS